MQTPGDPAPQLILASASPRRRQLLAGIGLAVLVLPADIDETVLAGETAQQYVWRLALTKARAVLARLSGGVGGGVAGGAGGREGGEVGDGLGVGLPVLAADTVVAIDGELLGKPVDRADALAMLGRLSGRTHTVLTAVAVTCRAAQAAPVEIVEVSVTHVTFRAIAAAEAEMYWATGEPRDKAGAYGIQGIGGIFAERIEGSYTGVMGLPIATAEALLRRVGVQCWQNR